MTGLDINIILLCLSLSVVLLISINFCKQLWIIIYCWIWLLFILVLFPAGQVCTFLIFFTCRGWAESWLLSDFFGFWPFPSSFAAFNGSVCFRSIVLAGSVIKIIGFRLNCNEWGGRWLSFPRLTRECWRSCRAYGFFFLWGRLVRFRILIGWVQG